MADLQTNYFLLVGLALFLVFVGLVFLAFFSVAPVLCASFVGIFYIVVLYLATEDSQTITWHHAQEFENRFWTITAFLFFTALFYANDSPIAVGRYSTVMGGVLVFCCTFAVHLYDRHVHRVAISRKPLLARAASWGTKRAAAHARKELVLHYKATAEEKNSLVQHCAASLDRFYVPSTVSKIFDFKNVIRHEQKIIRILAGASKDELNYIIQHCRLALVLYKVKDHATPDLRHRTMILEMLCNNRLTELTVSSRVLVLDALMVIRLSAHRNSAKYVKNIILKTCGDDLSMLKSATDSKGDIQNMHKLVFSDITDEEIRRDILLHIKQQANVQAAHMALGTKYARMRREKPWRKILSDVDDTLFSSGGKYPAGVDVTYPHHQLYPGILGFYRELDLGVNGSDNWSPDRIGNLVFLSARPHVYKDLAERKSYEKFILFAAKGMHCVPSMLAGSLQSGSSYMFQGDLGPMALKKYENFDQFYRLYPEFTHVFVGDNGQGDVKAAELMVETFKDAIEAIFVRRIQPTEKTYGYHEGAEEKWKNMRIFFFDTCIGAAHIACERRLIRESGFYRIVRQAVADFETVRFKTDGWREAARWALNNDLIKANEYLVARGYKYVDLVEYKRLFKIGMIVSTPFGLGIIKSFRGLDGVYTLSLSTDGGPPYAYLHQKVMASLLNDQEPEAKASSKLIKPSQKRQSFQVNPLEEREEREYQLAQLALSKSLAALVSTSPAGGTAASASGTTAGAAGTESGSAVAAALSTEQEEDVKKRQKKLELQINAARRSTAVGYVVTTPFGTGIISGFDRQKRVYRVSLYKLGLVEPVLAYVQPKLVTSLFIGAPLPPIVDYPSDINVAGTGWGQSGTRERSSTLMSFLRLSTSASRPYVNTSSPNAGIILVSNAVNPALPLVAVSVGSIVKSPFGEGVITYIRNDFMLTLLLPTLPQVIAYVNPSNILAFPESGERGDRDSISRSIVGYLKSKFTSRGSMTGSTPSSPSFPSSLSARLDMSAPGTPQNLEAFSLSGSSSHNETFGRTRSLLSIDTSGIPRQFTDGQHRAGRLTPVSLFVRQTPSSKLLSSEYHQWSKDRPSLFGEEHLIASPFGAGKLLRYDEESNVLIVQLDSLRYSSSQSSATVDNAHGCPIAYLSGTAVPPTVLQEIKRIQRGAIVSTPGSSSSLLGGLFTRMSSLSRKSFSSSTTPPQFPVTLAAAQKSTSAPELMYTVPPAPTNFPIGAIVNTPFGRGIVRKTLSSCLAYEVKLGISDYESVIATVQGKELQFASGGKPGEIFATPFGIGVLDSVRPEDGIHIIHLSSLHQRDIVNKYTKHTETLKYPNTRSRSLTRENLPPLAPPAASKAQAGRLGSSTVAYVPLSSLLELLPAAIGDTVETPYGPGVVFGYRASDKMYQVAMWWNQQGSNTTSTGGGDTLTASVATLFIRKDKVEKLPTGTARSRAASQPCLVM